MGVTVGLCEASVSRGTMTSRRVSVCQPCVKSEDFGESGAPRNSIESMS